MADNIDVKDAVGATETVVFDDLTGKKVSVVKIMTGASGAEDGLVDDAFPLPAYLINLEKAEDAAHVNGDKGVMLLGVLKTAPGAIAGSDGDYCPPSLTNLARLRVDADYYPDSYYAENIEGAAVTVAVTATQQWVIQSVRIVLTSDATVGDRQMVLRFRDEADYVLFEARAGAVQAASTTRTYVFAPHVSDMTAFRDTDFITTPIPEMELYAGFDIYVYDNNAVGTDDMAIYISMKKKVISE